MKIGSQHVYKIWRSLVEYRNCVEVPASATTDYLYALAPACAGGAAVVVSPTGRDADPQPAVLATTAGADMRLCDARAPGRPKIFPKDEHNYC